MADGRSLLVLMGCAAFVVASVGRSAESNDKPGAEIQCNANQDTLNACAEKSLLRAEASMKQVLSALFEAVRGTASEPLLKESQELWLNFGEADCRYAISGLTPDGSMRNQWQNDCRTQRTEQRTRQLKEFAQCVSAGCPGQ